MKQSLRKGLSFGLTSGIITTLGMMVGLHSVSPSKLVVIGGVLTIAVADAFSDALGIHVSEEAENNHSVKEIWQSTIFTFLSKFIFALTFVVPILLFSLSTAIIIGVVYGLTLLGIFSFFIAREKKTSPWPVIAEHLFIALVVIVITHYLGDWIGSRFS